MIALRRVLTPALLAAALLSTAGACSVPLEDAGFGPKNTCSTNEDCGPEGACATLPSGSACVAKSADLQGIVFEVRTLSSSSGSTISRVLAEGLTLRGEEPNGVVAEHNLALPPLVAFEGSATAYLPTSVQCSGIDESIPVEIELRTQAPYEGLDETYKGASTTAEDSSHSFDLKVPPGLYDVIVKPVSCDGEAPTPPHFVANVDVAVDTTFNVQMPQPAALKGTLEVPPEQDIEGWTLEVVEPSRGVVVSQSAVLSRDDVVDGVLQIPSIADAQDGLLYNWAGAPIIRLRDKDGVLTVHWPMATVDLDGDNIVALRLYDLEVVPKSIEATVVDDLGGPVVASVVIQSTGLTGSANQNASFEVRTTTSEDGLFVVDLVPGNYRVQAFPVANQGVAAVEADWEIKASDLCCGRTITVPPQSTLQGVATTPLGQSMANAPAEARPSAAGIDSYLDLVFDVDALTPTAATTTLDATGMFFLGVDPSTYDFFIKPPAGTNFPWYVRPSTLVASGDQATLDLGAVTVRYPAVLVGRVSTAEGVPTGAVVRAWLPLTINDGENGFAERVVQIGEAVADDFGTYTLALPPSIVSGDNPGKTGP